MIAKRIVFQKRLSKRKAREFIDAMDKRGKVLAVESSHVCVLWFEDAIDLLAFTMCYGGMRLERMNNAEIESAVRHIEAQQAQEDSLIDTTMPL